MHEIIISVIINPAFNAGEIDSDDPIGVQVLVNHVLLNYTSGYTPNNDYIPFPYIENPHIYILFEAEQLADGSAIGKSYRTTIELNTNFDRFLYKDIALSKEVGTITIKENVAISGLSSSLDIKSDYPYFDAENKYKQSEVINHEVKTSTITEEAKWWKTFDTDLKILKIDKF